MHPYVYYSNIYNSQIMQGALVSINRLIDKVVCLHTTEYYSVIKKNKILPFATARINGGYNAK